MTSLLSMTYINELFDKYNISFKKSLGQNFLIDKNALDRIILSADLKKEDVCLEIGPGIGTLTKELAKSVREVYAVEIDQRLIPILKETLSRYENVNILNADILDLDLEFLYNKELKVVANLPYYITTPIIYSLLSSDLDIKRMVFLVQKEVAQRFIADKESKHYGTTSITMQARAKVEYAFTVKSVCFMPRPNVDSAVIVIKPVKNLDYKPILLERIVKKAFLQRRKKITNSLSASGDLEFSKEKWKSILMSCGITENMRADNISIEQYIQLSKEVEKFI
ncbi:MAG: 16S rRNA (adenine(1518)-N(6)/adenine(1519)-N(6))-dimethyltransferase RsmA [Clostridia bacterium]